MLLCVVSKRVACYLLTQNNYYMNTEKLEKMSLQDFKGLETLRVYFESSLEYVLEEAGEVTPTLSLEEEAKENAIGMFLDNLNDMGQHDCIETLFDLINEL